MKRMLYILTVLVLSNMAFAQSVTFTVDMSIKAKKGQFNPATDTVKVAGSFNGWSTTADVMTLNSADSTYSITKTFAVNDTLFFKFVATGGLDWEADPNRMHIVVNGAQTYSDYFNRDSVYSLPKHIVLSFIANMEFEIASGRFSATRPDTMTVRGDFNGWSGNTILSQDLLSPTNYIGIFDDTLGVGETLNMKFAYITATGVTWESDPNKTYTITQADYDAGVALISRTFNNLTLENITNAPTTVTIMVNLAGAISSVTGLPFPSIDKVSIAGANAPLKWPDGGWPNQDSTKVIDMFNDGTHGDSLAGDSWWTTQITFPIFSPLRIEYKFGANYARVNNTGGNDNESSVGTNHWILLNPRTLSGSVRNTWALMDTLSLYNEITGIKELGTGIPENYSLDQNYPNPFNPTTNIRFNLPQAGLVTLKIYNVLGQEVATLLNEFRNAGSYEYTFNASAMNSGVYFYSITSNNYTSTKKMILVK